MDSIKPHPRYTIVSDPKEADGVGWGFYSNDITKPVKIYFKLPKLEADEVRIKIHYAGMCHTEALFIGSNILPIQHWPVVPGHEMAGEISELGSEVTEFKKGDIVAFGTGRDYCENCKPCKKGLDNICTMPFDDKLTYCGSSWGGYATVAQYKSKCVHKLPKEIPINLAPPLMCAGITVFNPISRYCNKDDKVAVVGLGGLGHLALKFAHAWGCHVTCFTSSKDKIDLCKKLGADEVVVTSEPDAYKSHVGQYDVVINTTSEVDQQVWDNMLSLLGPGGALVQTGAGLNKVTFWPTQLAFNEARIVSASVGSKKQIKQMLEYSSEKQIFPTCEEYSFDDFPKAWDKLVNGKPHFRCVIKCLDAK